MRREWSLALVFGLCLVAFVSALAGDVKLDDNSRLAYYNAVRENQRWKQSATDREAELVRQGDECLKNKDYDKAKRYYQEALDITYSQWVVSGKMVTTQKQELKLNTANTKKAQQKLDGMDATALADTQQQWKKEAQEILKQGDAALAQKNPVKAYLLYGKIVTVAEKQTKLKDAATVDQAKKKQADILKTATALLDEADKLLAAKKPTEAIAKLDAFMATYADLQAAVPDLKSRVQKISGDPSVAQDRQEQEVRKSMLIGDAAYVREDYMNALRRYQLAASLAPDTEASRQAAEKVNQWQNDPKFMEGLRKQEAETRGRLLFLQAETLRAQGKADDATAVYQQILKDFAETSYAARAQDALDQLKAQPAATPQEEAKPAE